MILKFLFNCILIVVGRIMIVDIKSVLVIGIIIVIVILVIILNIIDIKWMGSLFMWVVFLLKVRIYIGCLNKKNNILMVMNKIFKKMICFYVMVMIELNR